MTRPTCIDDALPCLAPEGLRARTTAWLARHAPAARAVRLEASLALLVALSLSHTLWFAAAAGRASALSVRFLEVSAPPLLAVAAQLAPLLEGLTLVPALAGLAVLGLARVRGARAGLALALAATLATTWFLRDALTAALLAQQLQLR